MKNKMKHFSRFLALTVAKMNKGRSEKGDGMAGNGMLRVEAKGKGRGEDRENLKAERRKSSLGVSNTWM